MMPVAASVVVAGFLHRHLRPDPPTALLVTVDELPCHADDGELGDVRTEPRPKVVGSRRLAGFDPEDM
jgi:hypothetical protein